LSTCDEKKSTVYKTGDEGLMRDVVNNQDVDKYTKMIRKYCSVREMRIRGRGKAKQKVISPLHDPGRDNVKQGKT
jgi:hypothetical protein